MGAGKLDIAWVEGRTEVTVSDARAHLPEVVDEVLDGGTVYLTRYGKAVAAVVPVDAAEYLERTEDDYWAKLADEALERGEFIPLEDAIAGWEAQDADGE